MWHLNFINMINLREETFNLMTCFKIREILIVFDIPPTSLALQRYVSDVGFLVTLCPFRFTDDMY